MKGSSHAHLVKCAKECLRPWKPESEGRSRPCANQRANRLECVGGWQTWQAAVFKRLRVGTLRRPFADGRDALPEEPVNKGGRRCKDGSPSKSALRSRRLRLRAALGDAAPPEAAIRVKRVREPKPIGRPRLPRSLLTPGGLAKRLYNDAIKEKKALSAIDALASMAASAVAAEAEAAVRGVPGRTRGAQEAAVGAQPGRQRPGRAHFASCQPRRMRRGLWPLLRLRSRRVGAVDALLWQRLLRAVPQHLVEGPWAVCSSRIWGRRLLSRRRRSVCDARVGHVRGRAWSWP